MRETAYEIVMIRSDGTSRSASATSISSFAEVGARIPMTFGSRATTGNDAIDCGHHGQEHCVVSGDERESVAATRSRREPCQSRGTRSLYANGASSVTSGGSSSLSRAAAISASEARR
jgi:hypothetical protein